MVFSALRRLKYIYGAPPMDNFVFKLCYRWTVLLLLVFSFVVTCRLFIGDSFACSSNQSNDVAAYINTKCYDDGVYTLPAKLVIKEEDGKRMDPSYENFRRYQPYYSWVNLLLLIHAFNFYLPHLLWKSYEGGYMYRMTAGVQKFFDKEEKRALELCYLAKYAIVTQGRHQWYMAAYVFFEACNYVVCLAQTIWLIHFFGVTGVPGFLPNVIASWSDFKHFYFPSNGICELTKYLSSGVSSRYEALCQLPLNSLHMKLFLFLHAWYILVTILCGLVLVYRLVLLVPAFRILATRLSSPLSEKSVLTCVCYNMSYSDWFFLSRLQKAMTDIDFTQMIDKMAIVGKDDSKDLNGRSSLFEDAMKDFDCSNATSPVCILVDRT